MLISIKINLFIFASLAYCVIVACENGDYGVYKYCENDTKHCIDCAQVGFSHGKNFQVPNYQEYSELIIDSVNDMRSQYAHKHNISNMRYSTWNEGIFRFISSMTNGVGNAKFYCVTGNRLVRHPTQFNHEIVDFNTKVSMKLTRNDTLGFKRPFTILMNKALMSEFINEYNMDEFACEYSFKSFKRQTNLLLRCIFYLNVEYSGGIIVSNDLCAFCGKSEICTTNKYAGLCAKNHNNNNEIN